MTKNVRKKSLRQILLGRRREIRSDIQSRIRHRRTDPWTDVRDAVDVSDADVAGDMALALLQMRMDTLSRIDQALARLDAGAYGTCVDCKSEIAERRLRALPFAVRCQSCEERREQAQDRSRRLMQPRDSFSLSPDLLSS
jgi:DnaK suppressor protein